jgi:hypothetical protein
MTLKLTHDASQSYDSGQQPSLLYGVEHVACTHVWHSQFGWLAGKVHTGF